MSVVLIKQLAATNSDKNAPNAPELPTPDQRADTFQDFVFNRQFLALGPMRHQLGGDVEQRHEANWPVPQLAENMWVSVCIREHIFQRKSVARIVCLHGFDQ